jgi:alkylated DNA repair protein (DNA oxidative demethylase)
MRGPTDLEMLSPGVVLMRNRIDAYTEEILESISSVSKRSPFRSPETPFGKKMSVELTNCGDVGWVSDRCGYRYEKLDPITGESWPEIPTCLSELVFEIAAEVGCLGYKPDICLINRYRVGSSMGMHRDADERDFSQPIVSFSLGLPITFKLGGVSRGGSTLRTTLHHGDVMIMGGPARLAYHGVGKLRAGRHPRIGEYRLNLTFRVAR